MIKRAKPPEKLQKGHYEDFGDRSSAPRPVQISTRRRLMGCTGAGYHKKVMIMRALLYLLFLGCLTPLLFGADLARRPTSKPQFALRSVCRRPLLPIGNGEKKPQ
jgi:hypothetical protein